MFLHVAAAVIHKMLAQLASPGEFVDATAADQPAQLLRKLYDETKFNGMRPHMG